MTRLEVQLFLHFIRNVDAQRGTTVLPGDGVQLRRFLPFPRRFGGSSGNWPEEVCYPALALAQHYDVPTRLLDWTYSAYVACYFAASSAVKSRASDRFAVWALDLAQAAAHPIQPMTGFNDNVAAQHGLFIPVSPNYSRDAQNPVCSLEQTLRSRHGRPARFLCFTIPTALASETMRRLAHSHVSAAQMYPGAYGAATLPR
jgi:hypothetical protein